MNHQHRDKFFIVHGAMRERLKWPYRDPRAIGIKLTDATYRHADSYRFEIDGTVYAIDALKAKELGRRFYLPGGTLPNLLPVSEFEIISRPVEEHKLQPLFK